MGTLFKAILLIAVGIGAGFVHAHFRPLAKLPPAPGDGTTAPTPEVRPAVPESPSPAVQPPDAPAAPKPEATAPAEPQPAPSAPEAAPTPAASNADGYFISIEKAKELFEARQAGKWQGYFLDARPYHDYMAGHIPEAMHLDKGKVMYPKVKNYLPGMAVVIYCHGENCTDSEAVAARLIALKRQIGPIHILKEGYPGWVAAGLPTQTGHEVGFE